MLINRDPERARVVQLKFRNEMDGVDSGFAGKVDLYQYSPKQYQLNSDQHSPLPILDLPPEHKTQDGGIVELPPYSITIVRGTR